jgi:hypothetical protein
MWAQGSENVRLPPDFGRISQQILGLQIDYECGLSCHLGNNYLNPYLFYWAQSVSRKSRRKYVASFVFFGSVSLRWKKIYSWYVLQKSGGASVFPLYLPSTFPPPHRTQRSVLHNYVKNSDKGLTDRALQSAFISFCVSLRYHTIHEILCNRNKHKHSLSNSRKFNLYQ